MQHSAILSTFIKLSFVIQIFVLSIFEWPFYAGFTVLFNSPVNTENSLSTRTELLKTGKTCANKIVPDQTAPLEEQPDQGPFV